MPTPGLERNTVIDTLAVLNALKAKIAAVQWTPPNPPGGAAQPAFDQVELFDLTDLTLALQELLAFKDRVCLIIHDAENFTNLNDGQKVRSIRSMDVALVFADRNYKNRKLALQGDLTANPPKPGVFALLSVLLPAIGGLLEVAPPAGGQPKPGVMVEFLTGELFGLEGKVRDDLTGRIAYQQSVRLVGGEIVFNLGRAPVRTPRAIVPT